MRASRPGSRLHWRQRRPASPPCGRPAAYARTRNALDGAVSQLSPYITHGFVTLADVLAGLASRHALDVQHTFVYELGWRAYFRHVWPHRGDGILQSLHESLLPDDASARELPVDIRQACTGVPRPRSVIPSCAPWWSHRGMRMHRAVKACGHRVGLRARSAG